MKKAVHKPAMTNADTVSRGRLAASDAKRLSMPRRKTPLQIPIHSTSKNGCPTDPKETAKMWLGQVNSVEKRGFSPVRLKSRKVNPSRVRKLAKFEHQIRRSMC